MKLIIVRHGETIENRDKITQGQTHGRLSKTGILQSKKLAKRLVNEPIDLVYCSDLRRCKQTLKPLLKIRKLKVTYTKLLRERDKGIFNGQPEKAIKEWRKENPDAPIPGGETQEDLIKRTKEFIDELLHKSSYKNILIVTHGGPKQVLLWILCGRNTEHLAIIDQGSPNTGITILSFQGKDKKYLLDEIHSIKHLDGLK